MRFRQSALAAVGVAALAFASTTFGQSPTTAPSAGAAGTWTWTQPGRNGDTTVTLTLQQAGDAVTGTITGPGGRETEIKDATFKDGKLAFKVVRDFNGQTSTTTYTATISGDTFTGKSETIQTRDVTATRSK